MWFAYDDGAVSAPQIPSSARRPRGGRKSHPSPDGVEDMECSITQLGLAHAPEELRRHPVGRAGRRPHGRRPFLCLSHAQVVQGQHTPSLRHAVRPPDWTGDTSLLSSSGMMMRFSCACLMVPCGPGCLFPPPALDMTDWWGSLANAADKERLTVMTCLVLVVGV